MNKICWIKQGQISVQAIKTAAHTFLLCALFLIVTESNAVADIPSSNTPAQATDNDTGPPQNPLNKTAEARSSNQAPDQDHSSANSQTNKQTEQTLFTQTSADQIKLLPFAPPALRSSASRQQQRLARHSQIVHSKVLAWLDLPYAQSTGFRPVTLDLFVPNNSVAGDSRLPLIIVLHEGNPQHFHSQYSSHFANIPELFANIAASGVTVAAINYRSPRETNLNGQVNDLRAAIRWLELNTEDYRLGRQFALWSFGQSADIVQAHLLHNALLPTSDAAAKSKTGAMQLTAVAMWQPEQLHQDLTAVPLLAINVQTAPATLPANQHLIRYRHFGTADDALSETVTEKTLNLSESADENSASADPRLDALSRSLQFLLNAQR